MLMGTREAFAVGVVSVGFRFFYNIYVDNPQTLNANWMLAIAACIAIVPMAVALSWIGKSFDRSPAIEISGVFGKMLFLVTAVFSLFDTSCDLSLFTHSVSYVALEGVPTVWIRLACFFTAAIGCYGGVDAIGSTARVWLRILFALIIIVILSIVSTLNISRVFPIFGPGLDKISGAMTPVMGIASTIFPLWLIREKPRVNIPRFNLVALVGTIALFAGGLLLITSCLLPPLLNFPENRAFQLDKLLTNGRVNVLLQLPLLFIWFGCFLMSLSFSLVLSTKLVSLCFPAIKRWAVCVICSAITLAASFLEIAQKQIIASVSSVKLIVFTVAVIILLITSVIRVKKGETEA